MTNVFSILTAAAATGLPDGTILSFDKSLLLSIGIQAVNIIILTVFLSKILYKPVKNFMAERASRILSEFEKAQLERDQAMELKEKYESLIADIEQEREEILRIAHKKAMEKSDQLLFDARREAESLYNRALNDIQLEREHMSDEIKSQIVEISVLMASRFVEVSIDRETQDHYVEQALSTWAAEN